MSCKLSFGNLFGSVDVTGYNGNTIKIEMSRNITYDKINELEIAKEELQLMIVENSKGYLLHYNMPEVKVDEENMSSSFNFCNRDLEYEFVFDVKISVPRQMNLKISTVDKGDVFLENCSGDLDIGNVNGNVEMKNVSRMSSL